MAIDQDLLVSIFGETIAAAARITETGVNHTAPDWVFPGRNFTLDTQKKEIKTKVSFCDLFDLRFLACFIFAQ